MTALRPDLRPVAGTCPSSCDDVRPVTSESGYGTIRGMGRDQIVRGSRGVVPAVAGMLLLFVAVVAGITASGNIGPPGSVLILGAALAGLGLLAVGLVIRYARRAYPAASARSSGLSSHQRSCSPKSSGPANVGSIGSNSSPSPRGSRRKNRPIAASSTARGDIAHPAT